MRVAKVYLHPYVKLSIDGVTFSSCRSVVWFKRTDSVCCARVSLHAKRKTVIRDYITVPMTINDTCSEQHLRHCLHNKDADGNDAVVVKVHAFQ